MKNEHKKRIIFLTNTRADFGKLKSLIEILSKSDNFEVHIFATGMHMNPTYGKTVDEIIKCGYNNIFMYYNHLEHDSMDKILAKTIEGFSYYVKDINPDLIVIHGDRAETLAGAIVGSLNNILTAHIEGGEVSGTIDELIRHSVSKLCHIHFVSNENAKKRLQQMGEDKNSIFVIGSPDIDIMMSERLPDLINAKKRYDIYFDNYAILMFHPVTTEYEKTNSYAKELVDSILESNLNYIIIYPNNDKGSDFIFFEYKRFENNNKIRIFSSIRFEYFLTLLKNSKFIIGNSSAGIREAPYYGVPSINIGTRQHNRNLNTDIINCSCDKKSILLSIEKVKTLKPSRVNHFGKGNSDKLFIEILSSNSIWNISKQKYFKDIN